jgi:hypothetical protein
MIGAKPENLIGDRAYGSDEVNASLKRQRGGCVRQVVRVRHTRSAQWVCRESPGYREFAANQRL